MKVTGLTLFLVLALAAGGAAAAPEAFLVREGKPQARIFLPRVTGKATLLAANELHDYLFKITGADVPVESYGTETMPAYRQTIKILLQPKIDPAQEISADGTEDVFTIDERRDRLIISGQSDVAVLYGVYQFLNNLGVRWFMPGVIGENVPKTADVKIVPGRTTTYRPSFRTRDIDYSSEAPAHFHPDRQEEPVRDYALWLLRNKMHFARFIGRQPFAFNQSRERSSHNVSTALRNVKIETEPERFALVTAGGETKRRTPRDGGQICFTHPANIQAMIDAAVQFFRDDPQKLTYPTSLDDQGGVCECPNCVKANGGLFPPRDPNRLVWAFQNAVAKGLREKLPQKRIAFYAAYGGMTEPPAGTRAEPGVVAVTCHVESNSTEITDPDCPYNRVHYRQIQKIKATGAELGCYDYTMYPGCPQSLTILQSIKTYHDLGYAWYHTESMGRDEQRNIIAWVQAQLAWDATRSPDELLKTFCAEYYGLAGDDVLAVLRLIDGSIRKLPKLIIGSMGVGQSIMTDEVIAAGRQRLDAAPGKVEGVHTTRLARFRDTFEMLARRAIACRATYTAMNERSPETRARALKLWEESLAFWAARDLSTTCSPWILQTDRAFVDHQVKTMEPTVTPAAAKELAGGDETVRLRELFAMADPPATAAGIFYVPELWKFRLDIARTAVELGWTKPEFDDRHWATISTWNFYERQGFDGYDGAFCYRVRFQAPAFPAGQRVWLRIGSIDDEGSIYINGELVHRRHHLNPEDWTSSFEIDVTGRIRPNAENVVAVVGNDEYGMGGIWKPCALYAR